MKTSTRGKNFIKELEGFRSDLHYVQGIPHLGYGFNLNYHNLQAPMSRSDADQYFDEILPQYEYQVDTVNASLNQNQYDALASFAYNAGHIPNALKTLLSNGEYSAAEAWILNNPMGAPASRRQKEADLFGSTSIDWLLVGGVLLGVAGLVYYAKNRKRG